MNDQSIKTILTVVGVVLLVSLTVMVNIITSNQIKKGNYIGLENEEVRTIKVEGEGVVSVTPDEAEISFAVITSDESSEVALNENNINADRLITFLKEEGVEEKNIQTAGVNVNPVYDRSSDFTSERRIIRYEVSNRVDVKIEDIDKVGGILDGGVRAGANSVSNLRFSISDEESVKNNAREEAIKDARERAEEIASALGVKIGRVMDFSESRGYTPIYRSMMMDSMEMAEDVPETPIQPGEDEVKASVVVEFEIK